MSLFVVLFLQLLCHPFKEEEEEEEEEFITIGNWRGKHNSLSRGAGADQPWDWWVWAPFKGLPCTLDSWRYSRRSGRVKDVSPWGYPAMAASS